MPEPGAQRALVVSVGRNAAWIAFDGEDRLRVASLRKDGEHSALVPGDVVRADALDDERAIVRRREPRDFALERTTGGGRTKVMAANVDAIAVVAAFERPPLHLPMIDELLAFAQTHDLETTLVFTKADLAEPAESAATLAIYRELGYAAFSVNPKRGVGVEPVAERLARFRTLLVGQSGVGKSSLFRALGGTAVVGDVGKIGRGRQTTSAGRLHRFGSGFLIDSPGIGEFEVAGTEPRELALGFREIASLAPGCRYADCSHLAEPACAVRDAVASGAVAPSRYASYRTILERLRERRLPARR